MKRAAIKYMAAAIVTALLVGGCGNENGNQDKENETLAEEETKSVAGEQTAVEESIVIEREEEPTDADQVSDMDNDETDSPEEDSPEAAAMKERFGKDCIVTQSFEVELNGCEGEVWFVSFAPSAYNSEFRAQVIRDGEVLAKISPYLPAGVSRRAFTSLDAVSFWDVNFDGLTDIIMITTYGDQQFAAVYYGDHFKISDENESWSFDCMEELSDYISAQAAEPLTVSGIRSILTGGKKNGEFDSYAEAYEAVINLSVMERGEELDEDFLYDLIYVDEDEIPELVSGETGYHVNLYTYQDGTLYMPMNHWGYGAMGNAGYEYAPGKNSLRNYNADQAGAIMNTYYMCIDEQHEIEIPVWIETYNFVDSNGNGWLDEEETYGEGAGAVYINGERASEEEIEAVYAAYDMGDYQYIEGRMTVADVRHALRETAPGLQ